ncbi:hypothetical protein LTR95_015593 [Oleoguttula sp. CCFEE 5521]
MAAPKPSPTDLLWAYKLKTEHQHLLSRLVALESAKADQDARLDSVEENASSANATEIANLTKQVKALQDGGGMIKQIVALGRRVEERMEAVEAGSEAVCLKVDEVEKSGKERAKMQEKGREANEKAMVKRLEAAESAVRKVGGKMQVVDKRIETIEGIVQTADDSVQQTTSVLERHGEQIEAMTERIDVIESGSDGIQESIARIKAEQRELAALMEEQGRLQRLAIVSPVVRASDLTIAGLAPERMVVDEPRPPQPEPAKDSQKSRERTRAAARELVSLLKDAPLATASPLAKATVTRGPPVRRGKGWIEVERTPCTQDPPLAFAGGIQQPEVAALKGRPARPAKAGRKRKANDLELTVDVLTQLESNDQSQITQRQTRSQAAKQTVASRVAPPESAKIATKAKQPPKKKPVPRKPVMGKRKGKSATATTQPAAEISQADSLILAPDAIPSSPPQTQPRPQTQNQSQRLPSSPLSPLPNVPSSPSAPQRQKTAAVADLAPKQGRARPKKAEKSASRREIVQSDDWEEFERLCEGI